MKTLEINIIDGDDDIIIIYESGKRFVEKVFNFFIKNYYRSSCFARPPNFNRLNILKKAYCVNCLT
jgi:hypothetical protein